MATLTPFGIALRKLRLDKGWRMLDLATALGMSVPYISAIETGRKEIPDGYDRKVSRAMDLSAGQLKELRSAVEQTRKEVRVDQLKGKDRELVAAFARQLDDVPKELVEQLRKTVIKSVAGETPFERKRRGILVPPMNTATIRAFADKIRSVFVPDATTSIPIMDILEFRLGVVADGFFLDVQSPDEMGADEGRVIAGMNAIILRTDVYERAWAGSPRDRFTACHEFGHYLMHRSVTFARARDDTDKIYCYSEWQADTFAGSLLMSPRHLNRFTTYEHAADLCGMSPAAAKVMWEKYRCECTTGVSQD